MIYLDNAATSFPKAPGMTNVMKECMDKYCGNPGRSGHYMSVRTGEEIYRARKDIASFFGIKDPSRLIFTWNTTAALNTGIKGVLFSGDHVVTTAMEHNSVLRPLKALEDCGISHTITECSTNGYADPEDIINAVRPETRLVVCTHASNVTGTIQNIKKTGMLIKKINMKRPGEKKILFMADLAQTSGTIMTDVDDLGVDMAAFPGHKGLLGPLGTGGLYIRKGVDIYPLTEGGTGTSGRDMKQPLDLPDGFEAGTVNAPGIIGLGYSVRYIMKAGRENIRRHEEELTSMFDEALRNMSNVTVYGPERPEEKTAVTAFNIKDRAGKKAMGCEEVADRLSRAYGIAVRGGFHCAGPAHRTIGTWDTGAVRISSGPFNTAKEIKTAIEAVYRIQKSL